MQLKVLQSLLHFFLKYQGSYLANSIKAESVKGVPTVYKIHQKLENEMLKFTTHIQSVQQSITNFLLLMSNSHQNLLLG